MTCGSNKVCANLKLMKKLLNQPLTSINLFFCILILILGFVRFYQGQTILSFYIGLTFAFFGLSHLLTILKLDYKYRVLTIGIRSFAYFYILYILFLGIREI